MLKCVQCTIHTVQACTSILRFKILHIYVHMCICAYVRIRRKCVISGLLGTFNRFICRGPYNTFSFFCVCERRELRGPLKQLVTFLLHFSKKIKILFSVFIISHTILALAINNMEKCCEAPYTPHYRWWLSKFLTTFAFSLSVIVLKCS